MLILARQKDEAVMIGNNIEIKIVEVKGGKVRLGISAPSDIPVHRKEVFEEIMDKNLKAADSDMTDLEIIQAADKRGIDKL
ncbi:MAG: carbon storage regulator CsrA [Desulforegulaceae bacterium]|nr:carbon storage regulator CsrA [Desulforegulaceae bacterium]